MKIKYTWNLPRSMSEDDYSALRRAVSGIEIFSETAVLIVDAEFDVGEVTKAVDRLGGYFLQLERQSESVRAEPGVH